MKKWKAFILLVFFCIHANAQELKLERADVFVPQQKAIKVFKDTADGAEVLLFKVHLVVNTDGTAISYHPYDLWGKTKAINTILNAIKVRRIGSDSDLCSSHPAEAVKVFEQFRDAGYKQVPAGFKITWKNVLVAGPDGTPCIFKNGPYKGYFGSMTALKNEAAGDPGECACNEQVNPLLIAGFTLPGGRKDPLYFAGARKGDLLLAYNPANGRLVCAVVNDYGPANNLGEATVYMNMVLKGTTQLPKNIAESDLLTLKGIKLALIPKSAAFQMEQPYTMDNITRRLNTGSPGMASRQLKNFQNSSINKTK